MTPLAGLSPAAMKAKAHYCGLPSCSLKWESKHMLCNSTGHNCIGSPCVAIIAENGAAPHLCIHPLLRPCWTCHCFSGCLQVDISYICVRLQHLPSAKVRCMTLASQHESALCCTTLVLPASKGCARDAGTHLGATLVFPLPSEGGGAGSAAELLRQRITAFRAHVDRELPGMYCWLSDASLHVTLRALMG